MKRNSVSRLSLLLLPLAVLHSQTPGRTGLASGVTAAAQSRVLPRLISDSDWETTIVLLNTGTASVTFQEFFYGADGKPVSYRIHTEAASEDVAASAIRGVLAPGSSLRLLLADTSGSAREAWSLLTSDGGAGVVDGYAIIRRRGLAGSTSEAIVTSSGMRDYSVYMAFDNTLGFRSQVALVNPAANLSSQVRLTYLSQQGQVLLIDVLTLRPSQQMTLVLPDLYPDLANKSGSVLVEADIDRFSVAGVRCNEAYGTIAALPIMDRSVSLLQ